MPSARELGRQLHHVATPVGPWRGRRLITRANLPHQLEIDAVDREIRINANGVIDWRGDRPDERDLQTGDELRWADGDGNAVSSVITRGAGDPASIAIAAAQRPRNTDRYVVYEWENQADPSGPIVAVGSGASSITWPNSSPRPDAEFRVANAYLYDGDGDEVGAITWNDAGDTVNPGAPAGSLWRVIDVTNNRLHIGAGGTTVRFDGLFPAAMPGDILRLSEDTEYSRDYRITAVDTTAETWTINAADAPAGGESQSRWRLYRAGLQLVEYSIRAVGFAIEDWQLWSDGSYYGHGGDPENSVPFGLRVSDRGTDASPTMQIVDVYGEEHTWMPAEDGEWWPDAADKVLVQEVRHGTNVVSWWAYFL